MSFSDTQDLNRAITKNERLPRLCFIRTAPTTNACWDIRHGTLVVFSVITQVNTVSNTTDNDNFIVRSKQLKSQCLN